MEKYQDYVIKDGRFVGRFEEMYRRFDDPWHQSRIGLFQSYSRCASIINIRKFGIASLLEVGCGLGHFSEMISRETGIRVLGLDISETAIQKARERFPHLEFEVGSVVDAARHSHLDALLFAEVTWYILDSLDSVLEMLRKEWAGKYLFHNLVFYKEDSQRYGREYFTSLDELIDYFGFELVARCEATSAHDDTVETSAVFRIPAASR